MANDLPAVPNEAALTAFGTALQTRVGVLIGEVIEADIGVSLPEDAAEQITKTAAMSLYTYGADALLRAGIPRDELVIVLDQLTANRVASDAVKPATPKAAGNGADDTAPNKWGLK